MRKPYIAVDFDGTIVDWDYPRCGAVKPGAREALQKFRDLGYYVLIWSCRTCRWFPESFPSEGPERERLIQEMKSTLDHAGIPYDEIDDGSRGKPMAEFYIDDKGVRFTNWEDVTAFVSS